MYASPMFAVWHPDVLNYLLTLPPPRPASTQSSLGFGLRCPLQLFLTKDATVTACGSSWTPAPIRPSLLGTTRLWNKGQTSSPGLSFA